MTGIELIALEMAKQIAKSDNPEFRGFYRNALIKAVDIIAAELDRLAFIESKREGPDPISETDISEG